MSQHYRPILWAFCAWCAMGLGLPLLAQAPGANAQADGAGPRWHERRERWDALDRGSRHDLRERFEQLHRMEPANRDARLEKARRFRQIMDEVYAEMDPKTKVKVDALEPEARLRTLAKLALDVARERSREADLFRGEQGEVRGSEPGARSAGGGDSFLRIARQSILDREAKAGLPQGVDPAEWQRLLTLEGVEFGGQLRIMLHRYPSMRELVPPPSWQREMNPKARALCRVLRMPPEQRMQWMRLDSVERRRVASQWKRERVLEHMNKNPDYTEQDATKVRGFSEEEFEGWLREQGLTRGPREGRRGPPREGFGPRGPEEGPPDGPLDRHIGPPPPFEGPPPPHRPRQKPKGPQASDGV